MLWLIPAAVFLGWTIFATALGIAVGRCIRAADGRDLRTGDPAP